MLNVKCLVKDKCIKFFLIIFILITAIFIFAFTKSRQAFAAEKTPYQVLTELGFTGVKDRSSYEYHFICSGHDYLLHFYADEPLRIRYKLGANNHHELIAVNGRFDCYNRKYLEYIESGNVSGSPDYIHDLLVLWAGDGYTKEDIINHDYLPDGNIRSKGKVYYVSGNTGVLVHDDSLEDLGYEKGSVFFSKGIIQKALVNLPLRQRTIPQTLVYLMMISLGLVVSLVGLRKLLTTLKTLLYQA